MSELDLDRVRAAFPGLSARGASVFFDNAGGSQVLGAVIARITEYMTTSFVQVGASYAESRCAVDRIESGKRAMAALLGAPDVREVLVGPSTTQLLLNAARALGPTLKAGQEVIVTDVDHEANIGPWRRMAEEHGLVVREWKVRRDSFLLDPEDLAALLGPRTALVAMTHTSNVLGAIHDVRRAAELTHAAGALLAVDGVAFAPHRRVDVSALGCDLYAFSTYKVYGPHQAVLWGRAPLLRQMRALHHFFVGEDDVPYKLLPGNVNHELTASLAAIPEYLASLGDGSLDDAFERIARHEERLAARLLEFLATRDVQVIGPATADRAVRVPTISFVARGRPSEDVVRAVDAHGIGIRFGDFYARRLIEALDLGASGGVVRVSAAHTNTEREVERLIEVLAGVLPAR